MEMESRKLELIEAALDLFVEKGMVNTSIANITERVGVARSLFYHYFADKQAIVDAAIDNRVEDFMMRVEARDRTEGSNPGDGLRWAIAEIRSFLLGEDSFGRYILAENNALLRQQFTVRCGEQFAQKYDQMYRTSEFLTARGVRHPREFMYVTCVGIVSLLFQNPEVPDDALFEIIASMLRIPV